MNAQPVATPTSKLSPKHTYTATLPDGREISRTTTHTYTHVVIVFGANWKTHEKTWGYVRWTSSLELARKAQKSFQNPDWGFDEVRIIPVNNPR